MPSTALAAADGLPARQSAFRAIPNGRRNFLRGLLALPLIGGGVSLIGQPSAVAEPVTASLLDNYNQWLWGEHCRCAREIEARFGRPDARFTHVFNAGAAFHSNADHNWNDDAPSASERAAVVLSAVGVDWRN